MNIYLIGFMGSGKTYYGQKLAQALGLPFVDLDARLEEQQGRSIAQIFEEAGEAYFRTLEAQTLRHTAEDTPAVVSCGGGTPCFHDNMAWINQHGLSVYLQASTEVLVRRLKRGQEHRPLIRGMSESELRDVIETRLTQREPFYRQATFQLSQEDDQSILFALTEIYQQHANG